MAGAQVLPPFPVFTDIDGNPIDDGYIYVGQEGLDPIASPVSVFWDRDLTVPATQPIRTVGGYPSNAGVRSVFYSSEPVYSILVRNKNGTAIYSDSSSLSSTDLESRLADPTDPIEGAALVGFNGRTVRDELTDDINLLWYRSPAVDAGRWDIALQQAIDIVENIGLTAGRTYGLPRIKVPGGVYPCGAQVNLPIWIEVVSEGSVVFDFSATDVAGFKIHNEFSSSLNDLLKIPAAMSPCLNGMSGAIAIKGFGRATSTKAALTIGNSALGFSPCRDTRLHGLVISGWNVAQQFQRYDTYLFSCASSRLEQNQTNIKTFSGSSTNSGERMSWTDCTIAGADFGLDHNTSSFDASFINCSLDFLGTPIRFGASSNFCAVKLENSYAEAWDGLLVDGTAVAASNAEVSVMISDLIGLPRNGTGGSSINSPSRTIFDGFYTISINGLRLRYERRPYLEDVSVVGTSPRIIRSASIHRSVWNGPVNQATFINRDWDLQIDPVGTLASALTAWTVTATSGITTSDLFTFDSKKVLRVVSAGTSNLTLSSKQAIPCRAGDVLCVNGAFQFAVGATVSSFQMLVEFFDDAGALISTLPSSANYDIAAALADSTLPNFGSGNARWMSSEANRAVAPKNAVSAKVRAFINNPNGTMYFSRFRLWRE